MTLVNLGSIAVISETRSVWAGVGPSTNRCGVAKSFAMRNSAVYFSALVTALLGALFLLLVFETWALLTGQTPITGYVRSAVHAYPGWSFVAAVVIGMVIGHVLWGGPEAVARMRRAK